MELIRICRICKDEKPLKENFLPSKKGLRGYDSRCKQCEKERQRLRYHIPRVKQQYKNRHLERTYGIPASFKEDKLEMQGNKCEICLSENSGSVLGWQLDHNHETGQVRGVLCLTCNKVVGYVESGWNVNISVVTEYLQRYS